MDIEFLKQNVFWVALAVASGGMLAASFMRGSGKNGVSALQTTMMINREDAVLIDVRERSEFERGHIANSRHVPLSELPQRTEELGKLRGKPLIVVCASGARAASACGQLRKAGLEKVHLLEGGINAWQQAGQPIVRRK